ncbi:MAG: hypothetical protein FJ139_11075 [Deltaproteobacteria bacterium]|nr:hypothetical protein [Deltaproteobacteria bacterium]
MGYYEDEALSRRNEVPDVLGEVIVSAHKEFFKNDTSGSLRSGDGESTLYEALIQYFKGNL